MRIIKQLVVCSNPVQFLGSSLPVPVVFFSPFLIVMENKSQAPKRRGRPAGSKNKRTKEAVTNPSETMEGDGMGVGSELRILVVPAGSDIIAAVHDFANRHQLEGVSVISTHGTVCNLTLYQPNGPSPFLLEYNSVYKLLFLKGNFYGSSSSIRPPLPFSTHHIVSFVSIEGNSYAGIIQGKLTAATNVFLGLSVITGTESIKLPLPAPRALPAPQLLFDLNEGRRSSTAGLPSGAGSPRTITSGLPEFSLGAGSSRTVTPGLPEILSVAGWSRTATAGLPGFFSGAGRSWTSTVGLPEISSGAGRSRITYGVHTVPSPAPLISWNPMTYRFSSNSDSKDSDRSTVRGSLD